MTTDELLDKLSAMGLNVTRNMLVQDVRQGYLPRPKMNPRGGHKGIGRIWDYWAFRRAAYLYRLRQRGATGRLLKVLLFLRDGWGWEDVRPICLAGLRKSIDMLRSQVRDHIYKQATQKDVEILF